MDEPLAVLLLPSQLEGFGLEAHARELLTIPRVIALEPSRVRTPRFMRTAAVVRQASRLRLPGALRLLVLYHPAQYPLARALSAHHLEAELWYVAQDPASLTGGGREADELLAFNALALERAAGTVDVIDGGVEEQSLRLRLRELGVISARAFLPEARFGGRAHKGYRWPR
jgi:hypothetical protein